MVPNHRRAEQEENNRDEPPMRTLVGRHVHDPNWAVRWENGDRRPRIAAALSQTEAGCSDEKVRESLIIILATHGIHKPIGPAHGDGHFCEIAIGTDTDTNVRRMKFEVVGPKNAPVIRVPPWRPD
jgi:hypothetical protein